MASFPEPESFNGPDWRQIGNGSGPHRWKCLDCPAAGKGYVSQGRHWYATEQGHHIVWAGDPRAKDAPRESNDPKPESECLAGDGEGRR